VAEDETQKTSDGLSPLAGTIAGRFAIGPRLGAGGMGEVHRAEDIRLKRTVAIKRLKATHHTSRDELLREARRASALNHPRIATVYDVFPAGDQLFLVMEYIDGQTLSHRMESPIGTAEFCDIALQCAEGLGAAHEKGILHGDVKPANIMITRKGEVKVCDFGLSRRTSATDGAETESLKRGIMGTPAYMAPEMFLERTVDLRSDIFALGVVFYEMLAGDNPFAADGMIHTLDRVRGHKPESLNRLNPKVPARLAGIVSKMIEKDPARRYSTMDDVIRDLRAVKESLAAGQLAGADQPRRNFLMAAVLIVVTASILIGLWRIRITPGPPIADVMNLAVLPFDVSRLDRDKQFFTYGLTDTLNEQLSRLTLNRKLQIASAAETRTRKVTNAREAREQLGANLALAGSVEYVAGQIRFDCALIETATGRTLRTEAVTVVAADVFGAQEQIVNAVVRMMGISLDSNERNALLPHGTLVPGAYDLYLQGRGYLLNYDRSENIDRAIEVFQRALNIDSRYALALAGLGEAQWRRFEATQSSIWVEEAQTACESALGINPNIAEPHACLGMVLNGRGESQKAADEFAAALKLEQSNDQFYVGLATAYEKLHKAADAEQTYRHAIELRPYYWDAYNVLGVYFYRIGRPDDAIEMFQKVIELVPDSFRGYYNLGACYFTKDRIPEAIRAFEKSLSIRPTYQAASNLGTIYYFEDDYRRSAEAYRQARSLNEGNFQVWGNLADVLWWADQPSESLRDYARAKALVEEQVKVNPSDAQLQLLLADYSFALAQNADGMRALEHALALKPTDPHTLFLLSVIYEYRLKMREQALEWLERAVDRGQTWREIDHAPALRELRKDPRFKTLRGKS
jgi:serine/threonine protein kinase/tetratricopeptide (TPR) repeat protein